MRPWATWIGRHTRLSSSNCTIESIERHLSIDLIDQTATHSSSVIDVATDHGGKSIAILDHNVRSTGCRSPATTRQSPPAYAPREERKHDKNFRFGRARKRATERFGASTSRSRSLRPLQCRDAGTPNHEALRGENRSYLVEPARSHGANELLAAVIRLEKSRGTSTRTTTQRLGDSRDLFSGRLRHHDKCI